MTHLSRSDSDNRMLSDAAEGSGDNGRMYDENPDEHYHDSDEYDEDGESGSGDDGTSRKIGLQPCFGTLIDCHFPFR